MLTLDQYSIIVALGCIALLILSIILLVAYFAMPRFKAYINNSKHEYFMQSIFGITLISIAGALIYQEIYHTPVCPLCWQQRMLIYAILIVSGVAGLIKDKLAHYYIGAIGLFGLYIASNHYYYHYVKYVLKDLVSLPCDTEGVSCTESAIGAVFGFVTIPFMSICVFIPVLIIAFLAYNKSKGI